MPGEGVEDDHLEDDDEDYHFENDDDDDHPEDDDDDFDVFDRCGLR